MAATALTRIIDNGARNLVIEFVYYSSTAITADNEGGGFPTTGVVKVNAGVLGLTTHLKVRRIVYNVSVGCQVTMAWDATTPLLIANLTGFGDYDIWDLQGLVNDAGAGVTGNILFWTTFPTADPYPGAPGGYTVVLYMIKGT